MHLKENREYTLTKDFVFSKLNHFRKDEKGEVYFETALIPKDTNLLYVGYQAMEDGERYYMFFRTGIEYGVKQHHFKILFPNLVLL